MTESKNSELGYCEGDTCNRAGCQGLIVTPHAENCSCHISPPCSACTAPRSYCPMCDWHEADDPQPEYKPSQREMDGWAKWRQEMEALRNRPLDNTKIDYRIKSHTHFSQICEGVYPEGTSAEEVRKVVNGTFGGRFDSFGGGHFKFIAYTD